MSIQNFTSAIQSKIYETWLKKLNDNIITNSAKSLRKKEQVASKTSFYMTTDTLQSMYERITGQKMPDDRAKRIINNLVESTSLSPAKESGKAIKVSGKNAIFIESISWEGISELVAPVFDNDPKVLQVYAATEKEYLDSQMAVINNTKYAKGSEKQAAITKAEKEAKRRGSFGYFVNKGHVISVATNLVKKFRDDLKKLEGLQDQQKSALVTVLDSYISKLEQDDIDTSNLKSIDQTIYASYVKDSYGKYLVEFQFSTENQTAGSLSAGILNELSKVFTLTTEDAKKILVNSPELGVALLNTEGSPRFTQMLANNIADHIKSGTSKKETYVGKPSLVAKKSTKVSKDNKNASKIAQLKALSGDLKKSIKVPTTVQAIEEQPELSLISLQTLINSLLTKTIKENMGTGSRRDILNLRTGRFAESVKLERLTQSREGMITAFYTYMRNPYATFSDGGRQESPKTRNPKLLIAKSIREIAETQVKNRLRAVLV